MYQAIFALTEADTNNVNIEISDSEVVNILVRAKGFSTQDAQNMVRLFTSSGYATPLMTEALEDYFNNFSANNSEYEEDEYDLTLL